LKQAILNYFTSDTEDNRSIIIDLRALAILNNWEIILVYAFWIRKVNQYFQNY